MHPILMCSSLKAKNSIDIETLLLSSSSSLKAAFWSCLSSIHLKTISTSCSRNAFKWYISCMYYVLVICSRWSREFNFSTLDKFYTWRSNICSCWVGTQVNRSKYVSIVVRMSLNLYPQELHKLRPITPSLLLKWWPPSSSLSGPNMR